MRFFATKRSEQMIIRARPKLLRLAVKGLHHQRIENADLFQCCHIAMNASERCVETVEKIVDEGFCAAKINASDGPSFVRSEFVVRDRPCVNTGAFRLFLCTRFGERCNEKETTDEETKIVKWEVRLCGGVWGV